MRVVVAYNDDAALKPHLNETELRGETEVIETAREVARLLDASLLPVRDVRSALDSLRRDRPDVVFNLCEGVAGNPHWEMNFALALEMIGVAFTGADPIATAICNDKYLTKQLLANAGCLTPSGFLVTDRVPQLSGTWIVKPVHEDAGIGIDAAAVCNGRDEVAARCAHVIETYRQPALVEEFIDGRELNQAMYFRSGAGTSLEGVLLPAGEILFSDELTSRERVVGWKAKWADGSDEDRATTNRTPAVMEEAARRALASTCWKAAAVLSIGGYCRFDVRQRANGDLCIIDVNPNPDLGPDSGFRKALTAAGIEFVDFLNELMIAALSRRRQ